LLRDYSHRHPERPVLRGLSTHRWHLRNILSRLETQWAKECREEILSNSMTHTARDSAAPFRLLALSVYATCDHQGWWDNKRDTIRDYSRCTAPARLRLSTAGPAHHHPHCLTSQLWEGSLRHRTGCQRPVVETMSPHPAHALRAGEARLLQQTANGTKLQS